MFCMFWPLIMVVAANILYNIASKSLPADCSPYMTLVVTYLVASFLSLLGYFIFDDGKNFWPDLQKTNWTGIALGISMVGLETGYIFMYRLGWKISVASLLSNVLLAVALLVIGMAFYREKLDLQQLVGIAICVAGCTVLLTARGH